MHCAIPIIVGLIASFVFSLASSGQSPIRVPAYIDSCRGDEIVRDLPYSAHHHFTKTKKGTDGSFATEVSDGTEARDSLGRTFSSGERHWTYLKDGASLVGTEMLFKIEDPVAETTTKWSSIGKEAKVIHWPRSQGPPEPDCASPELPGEKMKKLGNKLIQGLRAEGTRMSYTIPADPTLDRGPITVVHEVWYSPDLKIAVLATNDDPREGNTRDELQGIVRGEPDLRSFHPPSDYRMDEIEVSPPH